MSSVTAKTGGGPTSAYSSSTASRNPDKVFFQSVPSRSRRRIVMSRSSKSGFLLPLAGSRPAFINTSRSEASAPIPIRKKGAVAGSEASLNRREPPRFSHVYFRSLSKNRPDDEMIDDRCTPTNGMISNKVGCSAVGSVCSFSLKPSCLVASLRLLMARMYESLCVGGRPSSWLSAREILPHSMGRSTRSFR